MAKSHGLWLVGKLRSNPFNASKLMSAAFLCPEIFIKHWTSPKHVNTFGSHCISALSVCLPLCHWGPQLPSYHLLLTNIMPPLLPSLSIWLSLCYDYLSCIYALHRG